MKHIEEFVDKKIETFTEELFNLLRIPSVSTDKEHKGDVKKASEFLKKQFDEIGLENAKIFETDGHPIVYADYLKAGDDKPTVLVYGHYDVQPPDPLELWDSEPFDPTVKDGFVYARGASDDKGQAYIHVKSVQTLMELHGELPVNVKFILEGEEEIGSPNLVPFIKEHKEMLECDMVLISDTSMIAKDTPSITYGLRGLAYMEVHVTGPNRDLHSGTYGGSVANPINELANIISKLMNENGEIQIDGFYDDVRSLTPEEREGYKKLPFDEEEYKKDLDVADVKGEVGYSTKERTSGRPTLDVNGIWGGYQGEGAKTVLPSKAGAKISMRLVPDQDPDTISELFTKYIHKIAPNTIKVEVEAHHGGHPAIVDPEFYGMKAAAKAYADVYDKEPLFTREGGSIPIVADFQKILGVNSILMGFGLNSDNIHSPNERFSLHDFQRGIKTSARFFEVLGEMKGE